MMFFLHRLTEEFKGFNVFYYVTFRAVLAAITAFALSLLFGIGAQTDLPGIPCKSIRGMRNRIAHDYRAVDFKIVWAVTQQEIAGVLQQRLAEVFRVNRC